jgi:hypothetical protein
LINQTLTEYKEVIKLCKDIFIRKTEDYGTAWRILRLPSITDQIYIKAQRIRSIQEKGTQLVEDDITSEFIGIINYCVIALMQMELKDNSQMDLTPEFVSEQYDKQIAITIDLLSKKNHDYGEAWREMRISSITDIVLMKLFRVKQIEDNKGITKISEGVDANYRDMINYAVFCMIKLNPSSK